MNIQDYRQSENFVRNRDIWKYRFVENWSLKEISALFDISADEVREIIAKQNSYFRAEYA